MNKTILNRALNEIKEQYNLENMGIRSLLICLEDLILEGTDPGCTLGLNDPAHPEQRMHALLLAVRRQFDASEALVNKLTDGATA